MGKSTITGSTHSYLLLNMAIEIVDLPINSMVMFQFVIWQFTRG